MSNLPAAKNRRVLIIDDDRAIHDDFRKILCPARATAAALDATAAAVFGPGADAVEQPQFDVDSAYQGQEGVLLVGDALDAGRPYALAFVDVRMPPGWDGVETARRIWEIDPDVQIVICTAYSDYSSGEMFAELGQRHGLLILKKPFDAVEALQLGHVLTEKWWLLQQTRREVEELERRVAERTKQLTESDALNRAVLNAVMANIAVVDKHGTIIAVNEGWERFAQENGCAPQSLKAGVGANYLEVCEQAGLDLGAEAQEISNGVRGLLTHSQEMLRHEYACHSPTEERWFVMQVSHLNQPEGGAVIAHFNITERKRAAAALKQTHLLLKQSSRFTEALLSAIPTPVFYKDKEGRYLGCNQAYVEFMGVAADVLKGKTVMELWPGEMAVTYHTSDLELLSHPTRQIYEYKVRDKDGVEHPAIFAKNVFRDEHNQVAGIVGAFLDITERKRAEETLFRQTEMLQLVLDNIPAGVFWKGRNLIYMGCNSACARAAGLGAPGEIIGKSDFDLAWKASAEAYRTDDRAVMEGNTAKIDFEEALPLPDGSIGTIITNKVPLHDREGNVLGMMGTFEDITLRKRAGEEAARMVTVLRDSNDAITIQDFEGRITAWNRGAELMYGYGEAEALAMSIERLTAPGKVDEQKAFVRRLVADEAITSQETQRVTKDGRVLDVWMTVTKLVDKTGKPIGIASTERDTTALRKAEEALRKLNAELEQRVEQRTRELVLANDAAKAANRAKSDFLASMSHELRTPLNAIIGFSEILEDCTFGDLNAKQTRHVGNVLTAGRHLLSLINDILDLSKVEAGKMELELSAVPVKALLEEALVMVREKALQHRLDLTLAAPDDVVVTADERKLKQILFNLLSNAMKFTPDGGRVTVSARVCEQLPVISDPSSVTSSPPPSTLTLVVAVSDSGIGIGPEDRARLFQPFLQLDSSSTRKQEGTGLGLALARRFVELHGGRIWVESEGEGRGSTFSFAIPLAPGAPPEPALERFEWTAQLSVEVSVLDAQHRRLCGMLNTLVLGRDSGAAEELVLRILAELVSYAVEHFHDEEALMSQHGYPRLDEHVRQHLAFAARIAELTAASGGGGQGVRGDLVAYLRDWITHHILGEDMRYKPFFAARGVS